MALVLRTTLDRTPGATLEIVMEAAPGFIGRDFFLACEVERLKRIRTRIYRPQSIETLERYHRPFREAGQAAQQSAAYPAALALISEWVPTSNTIRLHSALAALTLWAITTATQRSVVPPAGPNSRRLACPAGRLGRCTPPRPRRQPEPPKVALVHF
jgi:transposase InsO family protein